MCLSVKSHPQGSWNRGKEVQPAGPGVLAVGWSQTQQACTSGMRCTAPPPHPAPCPRQHLAQDTGCNTFSLLAGVPWCG